MNPNDIRISRALESMAKSVDALLQAECGESVGFVLLIQPTPGSPGKRDVQYISTFPREHIIGMMEALLERWKRGDPDVPRHQQS